MFLPKRKNKKYGGFRKRTGCIRECQNTRLFILLMVFVILFSVLLRRLWILQIVNGQMYADTYELKITRTIREPNARGVVYDCNGEALAYNKLAYTVTMTDAGVYASDRERQLTLNGMIYRVIKKLEKNGEQAVHGLSIKAGLGEGFEYTVSGAALKRFLADVFGKADPQELTREQREICADELMEYLTGNQKFALFGEGKYGYTKEELQEYGLPDHFTKEELLTITGIRYMLSFYSFQKYVPVVLARDVSEETVAFICENQPSLPGIDIGKEWKRVYAGGEALSHILGYTGNISSEELEAYADSDRNYTSDSIVGKAGIEQYFEEHLQGVDGERQVMVNNVGRIVGGEKMIRENQCGGGVHLSIDKDLQIAVYRILEQNLAGIVAGNLIYAKTFDKSDIFDTSDIRIPVYDVYLALADNEVISIDALHSPDATILERQMEQIVLEKYGEAIENLKAALQDENTDFNELQEEMQEYIRYIVEKANILDSDLVEAKSEAYRNWERKKGFRARPFFLYAMENGWIASGVMDAEQGYFTGDEMYGLLVDAIGKKLRQDGEFEKMLFKRLIMEERIKGEDICRLLYDQQVLSSTDEDYERLISGEWDVYTFIKKKIEGLEITPAQLALDPCSASAVVIQPKTGKALALVSYPGYDNNRLVNQMDSDYYSRLLKDKSLPLYNRATQQLTAPGSTFKPVTIAAGLLEGVISADSSVFCDGVFDKVEPSLKCWKHSGHGEVAKAPDALQFSCNDYMCEIAYRMGAKDGEEYTDSASLKCLREYTKLFGLDKKSGIEIAESKPHITDAYGIPSAIGQGTHNYTTVQLARYAGAIASKGDAFYLSLVKGMSDADGVYKKQKSRLACRVELTDSVWDAVQMGMLQFAQNNAVLKDMKIPVAGKTGTAQEAKNRPDHALFIGYAPAKQPQIAVAVRIANGYGSSNATAAGKSILNYCFGLKSREQIITGEASQALSIRTD